MVTAANRERWNAPRSFDRLESHKPCCVIVVDRSGARFFRYWPGKLSEVEATEFRIDVAEWKMKDQGHAARMGFKKRRGYASWLNQVEIWFNIITQKAIRRGTFRSVKDLVAKIERFVQHYNAQARPFSWVATADSILQKVQRLCEHISRTQH